MALHNVGRERIARGVRERQAFTHGNVRGAWFENVDDVPRGKLPADAMRGVGKYMSVYVIFSHETPIAWHQYDGWTVPDVKYSVTTANHQSAVRAAIAGAYADAKA